MRDDTRYQSTTFRRKQAFLPRTWFSLLVRRIIVPVRLISGHKSFIRWSWGFRPYAAGFRLRRKGEAHC